MAMTYTLATWMWCFCATCGARVLGATRQPMSTHISRASFDALLDMRQADASFMREVWSAQGNDNRINSGHVMVRNNQRTRAFYSAYAGGHDQRHRYTGMHMMFCYDVCDDSLCVTQALVCHLSTHVNTQATRAG